MAVCNRRHEANVISIRAFRHNTFIHAEYCARHSHRSTNNRARCFPATHISGVSEVWLLFCQIEKKTRPSAVCDCTELHITYICMTRGYDEGNEKVSSLKEKFCHCHGWMRIHSDGWHATDTESSSNNNNNNARCTMPVWMQEMTGIFGNVIAKFNKKNICCKICVFDDRSKLFGIRYLFFRSMAPSLVVHTASNTIAGSFVSWQLPDRQNDWCGCEWLWMAGDVSIRRLPATTTKNRCADNNINKSRLHIEMAHVFLFPPSQFRLWPNHPIDQLAFCTRHCTLYIYRCTSLHRWWSIFGHCNVKYRKCCSFRFGISVVDQANAPEIHSHCRRIYPKWKPCNGNKHLVHNKIRRTCSARMRNGSAGCPLRIVSSIPSVVRVFIMFYCLLEHPLTIGRRW